MKIRIVIVILLFYCQMLSAQKSQLFLLAGQSNAVGQGDSFKSPICKINSAFEFDANTNKFIPLKDSVGKTWELFQQSSTGSVAPAFAKRSNELSGEKVYMVTAARGGASCHSEALIDISTKSAEFSYKRYN